tara:strand:+ start:146 stop:991 length:846 start_codon:yes stop_codon:yes gene_type:complete
MLRYLLVASVAVTSVNGTAPVQDEVFAAFPVIETGGKVIIPPLGVHAFYQKYINAEGILIVSSANVPDAALLAARRTVLHLLARRPDVHIAMLAHNPRISIMSVSETASDLPEFDVGADGQWGLGQMRGDPTTLVSERGICYSGNIKYRANFLLHEFVHNMQNLGWIQTDPGVDDEIYAAYSNAVVQGWFTPPRTETMGIGPDRSFGDDEYLTHNVNAWFNLNESLPGPWVDVQIGEAGPLSGTREQLRQRDPVLFEIIDRFLPDSLGDLMSGCTPNVVDW